jgi:hypothetical protein
VFDVVNPQCLRGLARRHQAAVDIDRGRGLRVAGDGRDQEDVLALLDGVGDRGVAQVVKSGSPRPGLRRLGAASVPALGFRA